MRDEEEAGKWNLETKDKLDLLSISTGSAVHQYDYRSDLVKSQICD